MTWPNDPRRAAIYAAYAFAISGVITILGGLGSTVGAIIGGIVLGLFESLTATYVGMGWAPVGRFMIFVAALIFIPGGIASLLKSRKLGK